MEIDKFCQKILDKRFPDSEKHKDVKTFKGHKYRGNVDIICGGFPCQPFSSAGLRRGKEDDRALFDEMLRIFEETGASWLIGENVLGIESVFESGSLPKLEGEIGDQIKDGDIFSVDGSGYLCEILEKIESIGCEVQPFVIPACAFGVGHRRDRVWIIAYSPRPKCQPSIGAWRRLSGYTNDDSRAFADTQGIGFWRGNKGGVCPAHEKERRSGEPARLSERRESNPGYAADSMCARCENWGHGWWPEGIKKADERRNGTRRLDTAEKWSFYTSDILRTAYGVSGSLDRRRKRVKALGNAIYPEVARHFYKMIKKIPI